MEDLTNVSTTVEESVNTQEVAEPVSEEVVTETEPTSGVEEVKEPQSAEVNAQYAAARRKAEEESANKINGINSEFKRLFGNIVNPVTGKNIESYTDYLQAVEYQRKEATNKMLQEKGIEPDVLERIINESPAIREAQQILENNKKAEASRQLEADLKVLSAIEPSIKTIDDVANHPSYDKVLGYVQNGLGLADAFKLANFDSLASKKSEAVKQAAVNQAKSKNHMETTNGVAVASETLAPIPPGVLSKWRSAYPELSMEQLTKKYNDSI
jgi:electron transfer flavoprotein alpha/beta subunit